MNERRNERGSDRSLLGRVDGDEEHFLLEHFGEEDEMGQWPKLFRVEEGDCDPRLVGA